MLAHLNYLNHVFMIKQRDKRKLSISAFNSNDLHRLNEILYNVLHNSFQFTDDTRATLKKYANWIRKFVAYKSNVYRRNALIKHPTIFTRIFRTVLPLTVKYFDKINSQTVTPGAESTDNKLGDNKPGDSTKDNQD